MHVQQEGLIARPIVAECRNTVAASYFPTWVEAAVSAGILGFALLAFTLGVKHLPVYMSRSSH
jgi:Ni/Fe-hydrogenase subunit HybB-like protein